MRVASSFSKILKTSIAQEDSANNPDFKHINNLQTSTSETSLLVNLRFLIATGLVFSTEFFGKVMTSDLGFSITLSACEGLAELGFIIEGTADGGTTRVGV